MKDLLEQVMPEFTPVPDRVEQVRRRAKAARDRLLWTGSAAAVLVVAAGAGVVAAPTSPDEPAVAPASAACDAANDQPDHLYTVTSIVPEGAAKVTMCIYTDPLSERPPPPPTGHPGTAPLTGTPVVPRLYLGELLGAKVQQDADGAIGRKVNAMVTPGECVMLSGNYWLVFEYENRAPVLVRLRDRCGHSIPREELLRGGDVLGWLDRMADPSPVLDVVQPR